MEYIIIEFIIIVILKPGISTHFLKKELKLNNNQFEYLFKRVNNVLSENKLPIIERQNNNFYTNLQMNVFDQFIKNISFIYLSEEERINAISFLLITQNGLSLVDFSYHLKMSKNTILKDLTHVKELLKKEGLQLVYTRKKGYYIVGDEECALQFGIDQFLSLMKKKEVVEELIPLSVQNKERYLFTIQMIEEKQGIRFNSFEYEKLSYLFEIFEIREHNNINIEKINTREVQVVRKSDYKNVSDILIQMNIAKYHQHNELYFLVTRILGTSWMMKVDEIDKNDPYMNAVIEMTSKFESYLAVRFKNKKNLYLKLYQHIIPAIYRIWYNGLMDDNIVCEIMGEYEDLHEVVKKSITPIEELIEARFNKVELAYITILLVSSLISYEHHGEKRKKAIVVCENGTAISHLIISKLKEEFSNIEFVSFMSKRFFLENTPKVDIVFSTSYIPTKIPTIVISGKLDEAEINYIRKRLIVMDEVEINNTMLNMNNLINIIEQHANIINQDALINDIYAMVGYGDNVVKQEDGQSKLCQIITRDRIKIIDKVDSYKQAIIEAGNLLAEEGTITSEFIGKVIDIYQQEKAFFQIAKNVVLPHASNDGSVKETSMSLVLIKEGVYFPNEDDVVHLVFFIAPEDNKKHLYAITTLHEIVLNDKYRNQIINSKDKNDLWNMLIKITKKVKRR